MARPTSGYLGNDLPPSPMGMGGQRQLGDTFPNTPEQVGAQLSGTEEPNPMATSAGGGQVEAADIIAERAARYLGLDIAELGDEALTPDVLRQLREGYPEDAELMDAIDFFEQQRQPEPPPPPDTTNVASAAGAPGMSFEPDRPY